MSPSQLSLGLDRPRGPRLVVLPDAARVEERLLALARKNALVAGKVACTLAELERELLRAAHVQVAPPLVLQLALREAARTHSPGPYYGVREQPGYAGGLRDLLAALAHGLLDPLELTNLDAPPRPRALGKTLHKARELLQPLVDPGLGLFKAVEHLEKNGALPPLLREFAEIELEAILDWTPLRLRLLQALSRRIKVRVRLPWSEKPELNEAIEPVLRALEKMHEGPAPEVELYDPARTPFLKRLFAPQGEAVEGAVELVSCASPRAQAREVARQCAALISRGVKPDSIAVAARSLGNGVAEELSSALEKARVPWRERRGRPALPAAPVRLALSLYEAIERGFPREEVIALLTTRLLWLPLEDEKLPAQVLARELRNAHVRDALTDGGYEARLDALAKRTPLDGEVKQRTLRLIQQLKTLPERGTLREHGTALLDLLQRWGLPRKVRAPEPLEAGAALSKASDEALARDQAALRVLEETCAGLARASMQLKLSEKLTRTEYARLLGNTLAEASLPPGGARGGAVQLVELRELPGRNFEHLFVVGLVEGELPAPPSPDPLLSEEERRSVNRAAKRAVFRVPLQPGDAGVLPPRQAEEPLLFQLALASAQSVVLLWPRGDSQGREMLRSSFADEAERALKAPVREVPLASIPLEDALARAALDAFAEPAFRVSPPVAAETARAEIAAIAASPLASRLARIARAAAAEKERVRVFIREIPPGRFSGQLSGLALAAAAREFAFGADRPASAHQLEENSICAFRSLGHRLLQARRDEVDDAELGSRERGSLMHLCLEKFFRAHPQVLKGTVEELQKLREIAEREMDAFEQREHVGHAALWKLQRKATLQALENIVRSEVGRPPPLELERKFGFDHPDSWPPLELPSRNGAPPIFVRGQIDRIDREAGTLIVADYKSSSSLTLRRKLSADTLLAPELQLPLYAALLKQRNPLSLVDAQYISLRDADRTKTLGEASKLSLQELLELDPQRRAQLPPEVPNLAEAVHAQAAQMRAGRFEVRPLDCGFCDLKPVCRLVSLPTDPEENGGEVARV